MAYAEKLQGKTLAMLVDPTKFEDPKVKAKGGFGLLVEWAYFGIEANNESRPDFEQVGLELKTTPLVKGSKGTRVKERLVLNMIDFEKVSKEAWATSSFLNKNQKLLLIFYWHNDGETPWEHKFDLVGKWELPAQDAELVRQDWEKIVAKIRAGLAHELSEGDTFLLGACTKGKDSSSVGAQPASDILAKRRAFSFKARYLKTIYDRIRGDESEPLASIVTAGELRKKPFEQIITERFRPYVGKTYEQICRALKMSPEGKGQYDEVSRAIMGAKGKHIAEFENAEIVMKTMRVKENGLLKEDVSFPIFRYRDLVEETWEESELKELLEKKFFFVMYRIQKDKLVLEGVRFWNMPYKDIDGPSREAWLLTLAKIRAGQCDDLPKKSAGYPIHVRPHARNAADRLPGLFDKTYVKKSFWLTNKYLSKQLGLT